MRIKNINGLSASALQEEVNNGGKFVFSPSTISLLVVTFKRTSGVYLVRGKEKAAAKGLPFILLSVFLLVGYSIRTQAHPGCYTYMHEGRERCYR